jgi:hypothetical protein
MSDARAQLLATIEGAVTETLDRQLAGIAEDLAERISERLSATANGEHGEPELIDAAEVARRFGVSRDYVYDHAAELGAIQLPSKSRAERPKPRLRFDPAKVAEALGAPRAEQRAEPRLKPRPRPHARSQVELLPIRGRQP